MFNIKNRLVFMALIMGLGSTGCGANETVIYEQGASGVGVAVRTSVEEPGENCQFGGIWFEYGLDVNGNGILDLNDVSEKIVETDGGSEDIVVDAEVGDESDGGAGETVIKSFYVCNGAPGNQGNQGNQGEQGEQGEPGEPGTGIAVTVSEAELDGECEFGGIVFECGVDTNSDGELNEGEAVLGSSVVCNGAPGEQGEQGEQGEPGTGIAVTVSEAELGGECEFGGIVFEYGIDTNSDGVLNAGEAVLGSSVVCNGAPGEQGEQGEPGSPSAGIAIAVSEVGLGGACEFGGIILEYGVDSNSDGELNEVEAVLGSSVVCNGAPGEQGEQGEAGHSPVVVVVPATEEECPDGEGGLVVAVDDQSTVFCVSRISTIQNLPIGTVVYDDAFTWGGEPLLWRKVHDNYGGQQGTSTLMAISSIGPRSFNEPDWTNRWLDATLRQWLNTDFLAQFSPEFASILKATSVPWAIDRPVSGNTSGQVTDKVFIASRTELGGPALANDGTVLDWFADPNKAEQRRAMYGLQFWTRTGDRAAYGITPYDLGAYYVQPSGGFASNGWVMDERHVVPMVNIDNQSLFSMQYDGTCRLVVTE